MGAFSEAQFSIGTSDGALCGTTAWPSDFVSGGIPNSTNRITITDLTSFLAPTRRLDSSPGNPRFDKRWDLVPERGIFSNWIAINDLTALIAGASGFPPMRVQWIDVRCGRPLSISCANVQQAAS